MAVNTVPVYAKYGVAANTQLTTGNPHRDGTNGAIVNAITGGADGYTDVKFRFCAAARTAQNVIRVYYYDTSTTRLMESITVPADNADPTDPVEAPDWGLDYRPTWLPDPLPSGHIVKMSIRYADTINVLATAKSLSA